MFQISRVDHTAFRTNDMEATVQFYCGILGMPLLQAMRGGEGGSPSRRYVIAAGPHSRLVFFDGHTLPPEGSAQLVDHFSMHVETPGEFDEAYQRLKAQGVKVTDIIERAYGKTFYFHDPNGILVQIGLDTKPDPRRMDDPDPVPSAQKYLG